METEMERREVRLCVWSASGTRFGDNVFFVCVTRGAEKVREDLETLAFV